MVSMLAHDANADPLLLQHHPMRNALTNVVGATTRTEVHVLEEPLAGGELVLMTTDGVHGVLDDRRIEGIMQEHGDLQSIAQDIVAAALTRGSRDNCTAIAGMYTRE
jgi:protein phosphatase